MSGYHHLWGMAAITAGFGALIVVTRSRNLQESLDRYLGVRIPFEIHPAAQRRPDTRTVMVTGGNGFLGQYIVDLLVSKGLNVIVFDVALPDPPARRGQVTYVRGNVLELTHVERAFAEVGFRVDSVLHTASLIAFLGVPEKAIWRVNIEGTMNLVKASARNGVQSFVYTSSATVGIDPASPNAENLVEDPQSPPSSSAHVDLYALTKACAEKIVNDSSSLDGMVATALRPGAIFGRGDKVITDKTAHGIDRYFIGTGGAKMDWVPVENVATAHVLAEEALATDGERRRRMHRAAYYIGNNEMHTYGWFMGDASVSSGCDPKLSHWEHPRPESIPLPVAYALAWVNLALYHLFGRPLLSPFLAPQLIGATQRTFTFRSDKAGRDFGYFPTLDVKEAIRRRVESARATGR